jgi:hypothetical protein
MRGSYHFHGQQTYPHSQSGAKFITAILREADFCLELFTEFCNDMHRPVAR